MVNIEGPVNVMAIRYQEFCRLNIIFDDLGTLDLQVAANLYKKLILSIVYISKFANYILRYMLVFWFPELSMI